MPRTKISEFSSTPANNTDIDSINISEGCAPSGINDAIRELMAQLKDFQTGAVGDSFNGPVGTTTAAAGAFTTLSASSTVTLSGGTANGVTYLNGSKVVTSGSALTFDGTGQLVVNRPSGSAGLVLQSNDASTSYLFFGDQTSASVGRIEYDHGTNAMPFFANASEQMRLTSTGLGIGTSSPSQKLDVSQSQNGQTAVQLTNSNAGTSTEATFIANNGTYIGSFGVAGASKSAFGAILASDAYIFSNANVANTGITLMANSANGVIKFATGGSTEKMRLDSSGNLGLGVTPSAWDAGTYALQFNGASLYGFTGGANLTQNAFYGGAWKYVANGAASYYSQLTGSHLWFNAPSGTAGNTITFTQAMTLDSSGRLGIGTTSPQEKLQLEGSGSQYMRVKTTTTNADIYFGITSSSVGYVGTGGSDPLAFYTGGTERARIDSSGNLLVGTTTNLSSAAKLSVYNTGGGSGGAAIGYGSSTGQFRVMYLLSGNGVFYFDSGTNAASLSAAGAWTNASDARLKNSITDIKYGLSTVLNTQPRSYKMNDLEGDYIGFVAQEIQAVIPEVVSGDPEKQLGVDYGSLVAVAFKAIQEQQAIIESLKARLDAANL